MTIGLQLLSAIIESGSRSFIRNLRPELFVQDERPAFEFFRDFHRRYGGAPSLDIMRENGYPLPAPNQSPHYLLDRINNRAVYNAVQAQLGTFQHHLSRQNGEGLRASLSAMATAIGPVSNVQDVFVLPDAAEMAMEQYAETRDNGGQMMGITLGWDGLDSLTYGAMPGEVVTWVARPNIGKSYAIAKSALAAHDQGRKVLLVSMEMGAVSMARRLIAVKAAVNPDYIKRGTLSMWGEELIHETIQQTRAGPQFVLVSGNLTKSVSVIDSLVQEYTPDVVYIDAQYLMRPSNKRNGMKSFEILSEVGVEVQQMAIARNIPVHQSVQYNREQKKNGEGDLSKIGGTDVVGQISSIVIGIRPGEGADEHTIRIYEILKNREGPLGLIRANFRFNPIDFSEILQIEGDDQPLNTDWMLG